MGGYFEVVDEIKTAGGQAVANYDSVEFGEKIVKTAIDAFGRVDLIFKVHVKGAYSVTKAAWPYMRKQNYGRIIVTSSNAGIYGNFGQTNYAAAKSALVGFSNSLAQEGAKYNILANTVIPTAGSRLTQTILPESIIEALKPEYVTPMVVYLCHESFNDSGKVFEAGAGWYGTLKYYRSAGKVVRNAKAEDLRDNWSQITNMQDAQHFENMKDLMSELMGAMTDVDEKGSDSCNVPSSGSEFPSNIKCSALFKEMNEGIQQDPSAVKNIKAIILYILTDGTKEIGKFSEFMCVVHIPQGLRSSKTTNLALDFKSSSPSVYYGDVKNGEKPTVTVTVSDDDFFDIANGKLNSQKAFMGGKLKVKGNVMLLQKLQTILDKKRKSKL
ncbi:oxidoreductase, short chain dehydrogenase/reductase family protein [Necator americanus]|uniref:Oxidoreductase, short chain dehydrogenase/reductase family protein n=1 Tax=Necator americanus TaxID=51031 RepID=W2TE30_NECAM|nr:oxidoreductase, short chain dehydrogenase/reductase family protein [Necator americanus]ETN80300.1 oxidoreductase, short chain dehydrogenase/reductase family protein [Necator americanus]